MGEKKDEEKRELEKNILKWKQEEEKINQTRDKTMLAFENALRLKSASVTSLPALGGKHDMGVAGGLHVRKRKIARCDLPETLHKALKGKISDPQKHTMI